jgi:peroxiredoxin
MRTSLLWMGAALLLFSCKSSTSARIDAKVESLSGGKVVVKVLNIDVQNVIDTVKTDEDGVFRYRIKNINASPEFYYIYYGENRIASLIIKGGDRVHLITDTLGINPRIDGSPESLLLNQIEKETKQNIARFDSLMVLYDVAKKSGNAKLADSLNYALGKMYVKQKQAAIKHIFNNPYSLTNVMLLYQSFPGDLPLFADIKDAMIFSRVHDSIKSVYPNSRYLSMMEKESKQRRNLDELNYKLENTQVTTLPEINLPDMKANMRSLNSLRGKVIILLFWTIQSNDQKMYNKELVELYDKYSEKGLEIYQVSVDADKTAWGSIVQDQKLPWICVHDGAGTESIAFINYNVKKLPTMYIINRSGDIVAKDIFPAGALEAKIKSLL